MADYYPLLARATGGLPDATPAARQAMYERARKALIGQLRAIDPPVAAEDIDRENAALDEAIAKVEAGFAAAAPAAPAELPAYEPPPPVPSTPVPPMPASPDGLAPAAPSDAAIAPPATMPAPDQPDTPPDARPEALPEPAASEPETTALEIPARPREPQRPLAPTPPPPRGSNTRLWIVGGVVALVVAGVAGVALKLRQSPDDLARLKPVAAPTAEPAANGKIVERVGRDDAPAAPVSTPRATTPAPPRATSEPGVTQAPIPVAQRAALLVEAPDLESKVRTFLGSTIWRLDNVPATAAGQPLGTAIHADVDLPEAKVRMTFDLRKNVDPALPAASTIEIRFTLPPGSIFPGVQQLSVPQMRREENPNGDGLTGVPVKITDTYFLIGLAQGDFEKRNNDLLRSRNWIDIPIQLTNNRIAKITLEKGQIGERIIEDALNSWLQ